MPGLGIKTCSITAMGREELREPWLVAGQRNHGRLLPSHRESFGLLRVGDVCCSGVTKSVSGDSSQMEEGARESACACVLCSMEEGPL